MDEGLLFVGQDLGDRLRLSARDTQTGCQHGARHSADGHSSQRKESGSSRPINQSIDQLLNKLEFYWTELCLLSNFRTAQLFMPIPTFISISYYIFVKKNTGSDGSDIPSPHGQKVVGTMSPSRPHRFCNARGKEKEGGTG